MERFKNQNWQMKTGSILILIGALSIFPENDTWIHTTLQTLFVTGCILFVYGGSLAKKSKNSSIAAVLITLLALPAGVSAQDYSHSINAFETSFHQKDVSVIKPYLSDSLKFDPLPAPNSIPVLTNVLNNLPRLNTIQILHSENGLAKVKYDFEQLGSSESHIRFDVHGKIKQIEFVENLIQQQIEQQRRMQSSVQEPKPENITFP